MGESDEEGDDESSEMLVDSMGAAKSRLTTHVVESESWSSRSDTPLFKSYNPLYISPPAIKGKWPSHGHHSASSTMKQDTSGPKPEYKLLHQTHIKLRNRILTSSYRLSALQTRGAPNNAHTNTVYSLLLYTYPETGNQVLFTCSRDKSVREWNLNTGMVERVITNVHSSSVLSICAHNGYLASAGSDKQVAIWHLESNQLVKAICDHDDSVLCVRFNDRKLVSCSKGIFVPLHSFCCAMV